MSYIISSNSCFQYSSNYDINFSEKVLSFHINFIIHLNYCGVTINDGIIILCFLCAVCSDHHLEIKINSSF